MVLDAAIEELGGCGGFGEVEEELVGLVDLLVDGEEFEGDAHNRGGVKPINEGCLIISDGLGFEVSAKNCGTFRGVLVDLGHVHF
jgi:hypothetical protein